MFQKDRDHARLILCLTAMFALPFAAFASLASNQYNSSTTDPFGEDLAIDPGAPSITLGVAADFGVMGVGNSSLAVDPHAALSFPTASFPSGPDLSPYTVVSVGPNAGFTINSGPVVGQILIGFGSNTNGSSGSNVCSTPGPCSDTEGTPLQVTQSGTSTGNFGSLSNPVPSVTVVDSGTLGMDAFDEATALSAFASSLTPTVAPLGNISGAMTFTGNGSLNVIDIGDWSSPEVTLVGGPNDFFVFNITSLGTINTAMNIGNVLPSHILWNLTGTSGNEFQTSGGGVEYGTFLATMGGNYQFSNLDLDGQLINTDGHIQLVSGSSITAFDPFASEALFAIPEPGSGLLLGIGLSLVAGAYVLRRRSRT